MCAAYRGRTQVVQGLIARNADVSCKDIVSKTLCNIGL